ncbi:glycoside hydrolase family 57 protein [Fuchsiella alkaliacetigena]|uniref:glycoside hydrolase family 57 protein n=1 Tax=Fuchsiella alkaliacetigena TaxID=957042 RepID=UPI002009E496|nr:1,4-alpha-glucan branching protein domain-containing protein [Fuchsiella alkaliacetigena]MCK8823908.1 DUF1957 domain-containing protein [Fuchsiella alkaliacetigena]
MKEEIGYLSLVLHAHLPFVRHPDHESHLEERWLYEAMTETYIPLLNHFQDLREEGAEYRLTMSLTPPLLSMLSDPLLQYRYGVHIGKLVDLAAAEVERTADNRLLNKSARLYLERFKRANETFEKYDGNLINGFKSFQDSGELELITCGATHGYLPLMKQYPEAVRAQIEVAIETHQQHLGKAPRGIWLPECGYYPGVENILEEYGLRFFVVDTHGILYAEPRPRYGVFAPIYVGQSRVAAFGRDNTSSKEVWSSKEGYPGDHDYREYYRDIGFDLPLDYVKEYTGQDELQVNTGIKYHKITDDDCKLENKELYDPEVALARAAEHAKDFVHKRTEEVKELSEFMDRKPLLLSPYDAELFGHWWYEGPDFINNLIREVAFNQSELELVSPIDYLAEYPVNQLCQPPSCSWGEGGYHDVWLEDNNDWIYRHLHKAAERMTELATKFKEVDHLTERALNQAARELLLAQSSDWAFIMKTETMVEYAVYRTKAHVSNFSDLYEQIKSQSIDEEMLSDLEAKNNLFPELDYRVYSREYKSEVSRIIKY